MEHASSGIVAINGGLIPGTNILSRLDYIVMQADGARETTPCILVVDDDDLIRLTTADFLESCGYMVLQADSAASAIACFDGYSIDLVFTDVQMPGEMDGLGLAEWVQVNHPGVPVIVTSGVVTPAVIPMIKKPYDLDNLNHRIQSALAGKST